MSCPKQPPSTNLLKWEIKHVNMKTQKQHWGQLPPNKDEQTIFIITHADVWISFNSGNEYWQHVIIDFYQCTFRLTCTLGLNDSLPMINPGRQLCPLTSKFLEWENCKVNSWWFYTFL